MYVACVVWYVCTDPSPHNIDNRSVERETGIETRGAEEGQHMKGVTAPQD